MLIQEINAIDTKIDKLYQENYQQLKDWGIQYIQSISKNVWTDFNVGDPGVTTLELLCYALTDLAYRTELPLADLLTNENETSPFTKNNSYTPREIFTINPLTLNDLRKLILDQFPEIRNVWLYPLKDSIEPKIFIHKNKKELTLTEVESFNSEKVIINGLYNVKVETIDKEVDVIPELQNVLNGHRNLCEDFNCIANVDFEYVTTCMDVDIDGSVKPEIIKEEMYRRIYQYCSPQLLRYSLKQMLEKGYKIEEILSGPDLQNGFFDPVEVENFDKRNVLHVSDIINLLMDIPGITNIRKIHLNSYDSVDVNTGFKKTLFEDQENCLHLSDQQKVFRFFVEHDDIFANKINFYYHDLQLYLDHDIIEESLFPKLQEIPKLENEWNKIESKPRNIKPHYSIQNEFPKNYLLGQDGIAKDETEERKIQRLQFKGFLVHFEQLMTDYLAQLHHVKDLYSWNSKADYSSYRYQVLTDDEIKDLNEITNNTGYNELFVEKDDAYYQKILQVSSEGNFDRRNRFLNHLIARFNDSFLEFSIIEFFKKNKVTYAKHSIISDKKSFLRTFPKTSADRLKALDYKNEIWNTPNLSGFEMRVAKKLGLTNYISQNPDLVMNHSLAHPVLDIDGDLDAEINTFYDYNEELFDRQFGFHLVEHTLIRPKTKKDDLLPICTDNQTNVVDCFCKDPYSFRITVVLPGWLPISMNSSFRAYVERIFREELPAHIAMKMCWISPKNMYEFEKSYFLYMKQLQLSKIRDCGDLLTNKNSKLTAFLETMANLENVYYPSHLLNCEDIDFNLLTIETDKYPAILNQTMLNSELNFGVTWIKPEKEVWEIYEELPTEIEYETNENGLKFYNGNTEITLENDHILEIEISKTGDGKARVHFSNENILNGYFYNDKIVIPLHLTNKETGEWDLIWCIWDGKLLQLNINKKVNFNIELARINSPNSSFNLKIKELQEEKLFKIKSTEKRNHFKQHDIEKIWFEKQYNSSYEIPGAQDFEISTLLTLFLAEVKKRKIKQDKKNKS